MSTTYVGVTTHDGENDSFVTNLRINDEGRLVAVGSDVHPEPGDDVTHGGHLSPGWTDLHAHVYWGATDISVHVQDAGLASGVTTVVDAGSSGEANWPGFRAYVQEPAKERVYAFLNLGSIGLVKTNVVSELEGIHGVDLDQMADVLAKHTDVIRGVKIRASHVILREWGLEPFKVARKMARRSGLPLMTHVGEPPPIVEEVLDRLDEGDVLTHCFNGKVGGTIFDDKDAYKAARDAYDRGVLFDLGHGTASFAFSIARRAIEESLTPHTISTDLHDHNIRGPVFDLPTTMSKMLHVGMSLSNVVKAVTRAPDAVVRNLDRYDTWLKPGEKVDAVHFQIIEEAHEVADSMGHVETLERWIVPTRTHFNGQTVQASNRFIDWAHSEAQP